MKICLSPVKPDEESHAGIQRLVLAQYKYFPEWGVKIINTPAKADALCSHVSTPPDWKIHHNIMLVLAGMYWTGDVGSGDYSEFHHVANHSIIQDIRRANKIVVPSQWVAECFRRDMRLNPYVIPHGVDADEWKPGKNEGYVLWNKNRAGDVCDPTPARELAQLGVSTVSTFGVPGMDTPPAMKVIGCVPYSKMKPVIESADIYLGTSKETFGIGTLEAMAAGIPVLGYAHGGTLDIVRHKVDGYLVRPGDILGLMEGLEYIRANRSTMSDAARERAKEFTWDNAMRMYANALADIVDHSPAWECTVVIPCYNYGMYLSDAIDSVLKQSYPHVKIVVVNDGSTDETETVLKRYEENPRITIINQTNQGVAAARNNGIYATQDPFIICLDADDMLHPDAVKIYINAMKKDPALGIVWGGSIIFSKGSKDIVYPPADFSWEAITVPTVGSELPATCIYSGALFKREMWKRCGGYKQTYAPGEDTEFWVRGLSTGFTAARVSELPLFKYRWHEGSACRTLLYTPISEWHPWYYDKQYPLAAPANRPVVVRSYSEPVVSVIIPVGDGHEKYVVSALDSLLGQTLREWEAIVVDDTDKGIPEHLLTAYPFARVIRTEGKTGAGRARNLGVQAAKSDLILFLDADDYLFPYALKSMLKHLIDKGARYVYTDWVDIENGQLISRKSADYKQQIWKDNGLHAVTVLMLKEDFDGVGGFDESMVGWEEGDLFTKLAISGVCGTRLEKAVFGHRRDTGKRRKQSFEHKEELVNYLTEKYKAFINGEMKMAGSCCGGNGSGILAQRLGDAVGSSAADLSLPPAPGFTRMEYTGPNIGGITYHANGRTYVGAREGPNHYANVRNEDIPKLMMFGSWIPIVVKVEEPSRPENIIPPTVREKDELPILPPSPIAEKQVMEKVQEVLAEPTEADTFGTPEVELVDEIIEAEVKPAPKKRGRRAKQLA